MKIDLDKSLAKITKGTGFALAGSMLAVGFALFGKLVVARNWTKDDYGIFSIVFAIPTIVGQIATLGLQGDVSQSVAFARGQVNFSMKRVLVCRDCQCVGVTRWPRAGFNQNPYRYRSECGAFWC